MLGTLKKMFSPAPEHGFKPVLTPEQRAFWNENGYLILKGCMSAKERAEILDAVDHQWKNRTGNDHEVDAITGPFRGRAYRMYEVDPSVRNEVHKVNNLFGRIKAIRKTSYTPYLKAAITELLEGEPLICNSLNFERGSQQDYHFDTWYMPPPVDNRMVAVNVALDAVNENNGPFIYYPGSHKIPAYRFSHGKLNIIPEESPAFQKYIVQEIEKRGLKPQTFSAEPGDVFIWHAQLYHGGAPIKDMALTRKSMVIHYWRVQDIPASQILRDEHGAYLGHTLRGEISFSKAGSFYTKLRHLRNRVRESAKVLPFPEKA